MIMRWRIAALALAFALLSACDDGDDGAAPAATPTSTIVAGSPTPEPTPPPVELPPVFEMQVYIIPTGKRPHDVAPAPDGSIWYTAQGSGELGILDPERGTTEHVALGAGSAPHGVIAGPDGAAWRTAASMQSSASMAQRVASACFRCRSTAPGRT